MPTREKTYQRYIIDKLVDNNGYIERKAKTDYNKPYALDLGMLTAFLESTQPDKMKQLDKVFGEHLTETLASTIRRETMSASRSQIDVLKNGIELGGVSLSLLYFMPATSFNPELVKKYNENRLSVMEEVYIDDENKQRVDLVIFLNGLPIISFELKDENSGQDYSDAIKQFCADRDSKNPLFLFKSGTIVNYAMDLNECWMTTKLDGTSTRFIPFNKGKGEGIQSGAGNPDDDGSGDFPVHYMWDDILTKDSIIEIVTKFCFVQKKTKKNEATGKSKPDTSIVFPRYHQRDAVRKIIEDVKINHSSLNYLIEHSAGSGKSNTIAWLAYRLSSLHDADDKQIFDTVLIVTDRVVVDDQLQKVIKSIDHKEGYIKVISDKDTKVKGTSADLKDALKGNTKIICTTIQKFIYVAQDIFDIQGEMANKTFAVIIDEAHSSTAGKDMTALHRSLGGVEEDTEDYDTEDYTAEDRIEQQFAEAVKRNGKQANVSIFAFTATPKPTTIQLFGREDKKGQKQAFHLYSMKQAIEEGFILDVLQNYIEYKTYYELCKQTEDDPLLKTNAAKRQIARFVDLTDDNINQRVNIIIEHFRTSVMEQLGGQAKAMVITASRDAAVKYQKAFNAYIQRMGYSDIHSLVAFSGKVILEDDPTKTEYTEKKMNGIPEDKLPDTFDTDDYNVLIVADKYQTGFDQPKLCALYVLKKLKNVNAVQTLSRLNRTCHPFDKQVVVMDFVNTCEQMIKAYAPFYTSTILANSVSASQLIELESKIDGYYILDDEDVQNVAECCMGKYGAKQDKIVNKCVNRAVNVMKKQYNEEQQREFIAHCRGYVRLYNFLSLASSFGDEELYKKYLFIDTFLQRFKRSTGGTINLRDKVNAQNFVQQEIGDKGRKTQPSAPLVKLAGVKINLTEDEEQKLSEIIKEINLRSGKKLDTDVATKSALQIKDILLKSDRLRASAKTNSESDFRFSYDSETDEALLSGLEQNQDFFTLLLNDDELKKRVLGIFAPEIYKALRESE